MTDEKLVCGLCASREIGNLHTIREVELKRCRSCGLVFVFPMPGAAELREAYQGDYFQSSDQLGWGYEDYFSLERQVRRMARGRLNIMARYARSGRLLESGCATGWFLDEARRRGYQVQGVELADVAAEWGRTRLDLPVITGTLAQAAFPAASFDIAALWNVFEHLPDPFAELREINRVLEPGGYLFVTVPNQGSLVARVMGRRWFGYSKVREHLYYFNAETLRYSLDQAGFDMLEVQSSPYMVNMDFIADKLGQYSRTLARAAGKALRAARLGDRDVNVRFLDIMGIGRKR